MPKRRPGTKAGLSRSLVLSTALRIADEGGLATLTMRRLADRLGVEPMTLYDHVPNKAALVDGLVESVIARAVDLDVLEDISWQQAIQEYASSLRRTLLEHPGVLPLMLTEAGVTPRSLAGVESGLGTLHTAGFSLPQAAALLNAVNLFTIAHTMTSRQRPTSPSTESRFPFDPEAYPLTLELVRTQGAGVDGFDLTIDAILAGFATLRRKETPGTTEPPE